MRSVLWGIVVASSTLTGWLALGSGCGALPTDCAERFTCPPGAGGGSSASSASTTTSTGVGGGPPLTCVPTAGKDPIADSCGVFVSSGVGVDAPDAGSRAKPYKTLAAAITAAVMAKKPVYACAETFTEALIVAAGVGIYGGLDCKKDWGYSGAAKSTLTAGADAVPLVLSSGANGVALFDFEVVAVDAVISGGSSIAVIADQVAASFTRCDLVARNGKDGTAGVMSTDSVGPTTPTASEIRGNDGANACTDASSVTGGLPKENTLCMLANNPIGGLGGTGLVSNGTAGQAPSANAQTAQGGTGQPNMDPTWDCTTGAGHIGAKGTFGTDGAGAKGLGVIAASGYGGVAGSDASVGQPGRGGGGGGGAKGKAGCAGASGGGGGTGGCGGHGGTGGKAGGASIALISLNATLSFDTVTVVLGAGGAGGDGGDGQPGGVGGLGGVAGFGSGGTSGACAGGYGGDGGFGGKGGGGHGGHSIGITVSGSVVLETKGVMFAQQGKAGPGGKGGPLQDGDLGVQAPVQMFP